MIRFLLDTDICISLLRNIQPDVVARFKEHQPGEVAVPRRVPRMQDRTDLVDDLMRVSHADSVQCSVRQFHRRKSFNETAVRILKFPGTVVRCST